MRFDAVYSRKAASTDAAWVGQVGVIDPFPLNGLLPGTDF